MTVRQLTNLLCREFDDYGRPKATRRDSGGSDVVNDPLASFREHCRLNGILDERTVRGLYAERQKQQPATASEHSATPTG